MSLGISSLSEAERNSMDAKSYLERLQGGSKRVNNRRLDLSEVLDTILSQNAVTAPMERVPPAPPSSPVGAPASPATPVGKGGGGVDDWINQALGILKLDSGFAPGIKNMIMKESSGNPNAINKWDSNWKKGTPSKGLMQTIDPTFKQWALPGYNSNVFDPVSNIIAGIRYAQNRYGNDMLRAGGRKNSAGKYIGY
jgi:hypothetical protein